MNRRDAKTILVIDDQAIARRTVRRLLEYHGFEVLEAASGAEGLVLFQRESARIALVVLDLTLPDILGPDMLARMRSMKPEAQIAVCTDESITDLKRSPQYQEAAGYLRKPIRTDRLLAVVREALEL